MPKALLVHLRLGYVLALPLSAVLLGLPIWYDFMRFTQLGGSVQAARTLAYNDPQHIGAGLTAIAVLLFLVPLAGGFARVRLRSWMGATGVLGARSLGITLAHVVLATFIGWCAFIACYFPQSLGPSATGSEVGFAFNLLGTPLVTLAIIAPSAKLALIIVTALIPDAVRILASGGEREPNWLDRYLTRANLADLHGDYYPVEGRHRGNFNAAAMSPAIRAVRRRTARFHHEYQDTQPGSVNAETFLRTRWEKVRRKLWTVLPEVDDLDRVLGKTYLFESTSRAVHALLTQSDPVRVILSPFEHESEIAVASAMPDTEVHVIPRRGEWLEDVAGAAAAEVAERIIRALSPGRNAVLISEVCCVTGLPVPFREIVQGLREHEAATQGVELFIIIDGAHCVGNVPVRGISVGDAYVFSGHKWLMAEFPSGVAIGVSEKVSLQGLFDAWADSVSVTTADQGTIISLEAALDWRLRLGDHWDDLEERCTLLREYFCDNLPIEFEVIGTLSPKMNSKMVAIRPKDGLRWHPVNVRLALAKEGLNCESFAVLNDDGEETWLRVSLAYFLDTTSVDQLHETLTSLVRT